MKGNDFSGQLKKKMDEEGYLNEKEYKKAVKLSDEIGAMLWCSIQSLK